jgi:hypothetical protein
MRDIILPPRPGLLRDLHVYFEVNIYYCFHEMKWLNREANHSHPLMQTHIVRSAIAPPLISTHATNYICTFVDVNSIWHMIFLISSCSGYLSIASSSTESTFSSWLGEWKLSYSSPSIQSLWQVCFYRFKFFTTLYVLSLHLYTPNSKATTYFSRCRLSAFRAHRFYCGTHFVLIRSIRNTSQTCGLLDCLSRNRTHEMGLICGMLTSQMYFILRSSVIAPTRWVRPAVIYVTCLTEASGSNQERRLHILIQFISIWYELHYSNLEKLRDSQQKFLF